MNRWTEADIRRATSKGIRTKYGAKRVSVDNIQFDSKAESARYHELKLMLSQNLISDLKVHPVFPIVYNESRICDVELDFAYFNGERRIYEDVKSAGTNTALSKLKRKLAESFHGIHIELIGL